MNWPDYGDPRLPGRYWDKVHLDLDTGCWIWTGSSCRKGYGQCKIQGKTHAAHRVAFQALVGDPISSRLPGGCNARLCVNPAHRRLPHGAKLREPSSPFEFPAEPQPLAERRRLSRASTRSRTFVACMVLAAVQAQEARVEAERLRILKGANPALIAA